MEIIYRAKDGEEFKSEYACQEYELNLAFNNNPNYKLFDANMQPTKDPDDVWYAKFNSCEDIQAFNNICDERGVWGVECDIDETKPLAFYYDTTNDCYAQYGVEIEELKSELSNLKEWYEKLLSI